MPITVLDPKTALVVIDLQNGIVAMAAGQDLRPLIANAASLVAEFRAHKQPVVLVTVNPSRAPRRADQARPVPELPPEWLALIPEMSAVSGDHCITKQSWGAFTGTGLEAWLRSQGVTQIVLCGIATSIGVETTARQAFEAGFNIAFAVDAMTDLHAEAHENSITRIFPRLGETGTAADIIARLNAV